MKTKVIFIAILISVFSVSYIYSETAITQEEKPRVQIAILLDTSGSMSGLIEQAKSQLWKIVNEFIFSRQNGKMPVLEVALYEYGKSSLSGEEGYIRQIMPLTRDLDGISEELFALKTNGGSEYCGWVIQNAVTELKWSTSPMVYKSIFIAGNEPFTQGKIDYKESCKMAVEKGITVNTIHCGTYEQGIAGKWQDGAVLADGSYTHIDHNKEAIHIAAPQDDELARLGVALNETYIPYGKEGRVMHEKQAEQDSNAMNYSSSNMAQRAAVKASGLYSSSGWDLVDAFKNDTVELDKLEVKELPEAMQQMNIEEQKVYILKASEKRDKLQAKIKTLNEAREKFIAEKKKELATNGEDTLDAVIIKTIHTQAEKKNFEFKK